MRRAATVLGIAAVVATACGGCRDESLPPTDSVAVLWYGSTEETAAFEAAVASFRREHAAPAITVVRLRKEDVASTVTRWVAGGRPPELARLGVRDLGAFAHRDALADIAAEVAADELAAFDAARLELCRIDGRLAGLPLTTHVAVVYFNADVARKAGVEPPATPLDPWTVEEFAKAAERMREAAGAGFGWAAADDPWLLAPMFRIFGATLDGLPRDRVFHESREAVEWLWSQQRTGTALLAAFTGDGGGPAREMFVAGRSGLLIDWSSAISVFEMRIRGFRWDVTYLPRAARAATNVTGDNLLAFQTPRRTETVRLLAHLSAKTQHAVLTSAAGSLPARRDVFLPAGPSEARLRTAARQMDAFEAAWANQQTLPAFDRTLRTASELLHEQGARR